MKRMFFKLVAIILSLVMASAMLTACGSSAEPAIDEVVDAAVKAALEAAVVPTTVTIEADGRQVTIEDAEDKTVQQLLEQADIDLNDGDVLSVSPNQTLTGNITLYVLRKSTVTVKVDGEDTVVYTAVLMNGTVADAIAAVGLELSDDQLVNYELDQILENGMEIIISPAEVAEETEATEPEKTTSGSSSSGSSSSGGSSSGGSSSGGSSSGGSSSSDDSSSSGSSDTGSSTENERTVVSVVYYDDCDGSGHGVKVITYSDGTQEEVPY